MLLFQRLKAKFKQLEDIQTERDHVPDENSDFVNLPEGHLIQMTCGHRGLPYRMEEKRVSRLLRKSGFIPMLEAQAN